MKKECTCKFKLFCKLRKMQPDFVISNDLACRPPSNEKEEAQMLDQYQQKVMARINVSLMTAGIFTFFLCSIIFVVAALLVEFKLS